MRPLGSYREKCRATSAVTSCANHPPFHRSPAPIDPLPGGPDTHGLRRHLGSTLGRLACPHWTQDMLCIGLPRDSAIH